MKRRKSIAWQGKRVLIHQEPRSIDRFELSRPYVVKRGKKLYVVTLHTDAGEHYAHPVVEVRG